jgi:hypothetical protein
MNVLFGVCARLVPLAAADFAPELPPNSPETREQPASSTGSQHAVLGFSKRRGGIRTPGTTCVASGPVIDIRLLPGFNGVRVASIS